MIPRDLSDAELVTALAKRLRGARATSVYLRELGPGAKDMTWASAHTTSTAGHAIEAKVAAGDLVTSLRLLLGTLERMTAP
jgi:hypothetical protein